MNADQAETSRFIPSEIIERGDSARLLAGRLLQDDTQTLWDPTISPQQRGEALNRFSQMSRLVELCLRQEHQSSIDSLTGLYNRGAFYERFDELLDFTWRKN